MIINPEEQYEILDSLNSSQSYMYVYFHTQINQISILKSKNPYLLIYNSSGEISIQQLIAQFEDQIKYKKVSRRMQWYLEGGYKLQQSLTINKIKQQLRKKNINGLQVFTKLTDPQLTQQCAVFSFIQSQKQFNKGAIQYCFTIQPLNFKIYILIQANILNIQVKQLLAVEIKRIFTANVDPKKIKIFIQGQNTFAFQDNHRFQPSQFKQKLMIKIMNMALKLPPRQYNCIIVFKPFGVLENPIKYHYDDIKFKKASQLLTQIDSKQNWSQFGVLISEIVIKPFESFQKIEVICKKAIQNTMHISAYIIKQDFMFDHEMKNTICKLKQVDFQEIILQDQKQKKNQCQKTIKERAKTASHKQFKDKDQNVKPILLYTSQLRVIGSDNKTKAPIYNRMNQFLREQPFISIQEHQYLKWQLRFASELTRQLEKVPKANAIDVWRGVSYIQKHQLNQHVVWKQFSSCSTSQQIALKFAKTIIYKIKAESGRPIKQYSFYQKQNQILFAPYFEIQIIKITENYTDKNLTLYEGVQIKKAAPIDNKNLFVLWVDDKPQEGKRMWEKMSMTQKSTIMIPLLSTQQLLKWLIINQKWIKDQTIQIILITNMTRVEKNTKNEIAGVQGLKIFRKHRPQSAVFFYIGWVEGTIKKLKQQGFAPNQKLIVSKYQDELKDFLNKKGIK